MLPVSGGELSEEKAENVMDKPEPFYPEQNADISKTVWKVFGIPIFSLTRTLNGEELLYRRLEVKLLNGIEKGLYDRVEKKLLIDIETHLASLLANGQKPRG